MSCSKREIHLLLTRLTVYKLSHVSAFRCAELEKEVAVLKEKIHHLDDMLMSQQRKVRHMIEQVFMHIRMLPGGA